MKDTFHIVPSSYDDDGFPVWRTPLTPAKNTTRAMILAPPDHVIPVIFVPGVMGSNLKLVAGIGGVKNAGEFAWRPDQAGGAEAVLDAATRQLLLNPNNTKIDSRFIVDKKKDVTLPHNMSLKCVESRGWGSVYWKSYGAMLMYLESLLNLPCFYDPDQDKVLINALFRSLIDVGITLPGKPSLKLEKTELEKMSDYWFPMHAFGYNWLQSNGDAGISLANEIRRIKLFYQEKMRLPDACKKVILITHSMGGLVARAAAHPDIGKAENNILGIIHGVMPAIGAAAAYKRMRTGFEHGEIDWFSMGSVKSQLGGQAVAGRNGRDVTAVLGHAPGGLQLLPNKAYTPEGWLKMTGIEAQPYTVPINGNPYDSIYREQKKWWRLINPEWLDPAMLFEQAGPRSAWDSFNRALTKAETFHGKLGHHYHPNTYCFHGEDAKHRPSYGMVIWKKAGSSYQGIFSAVGNAETNVNLMKNGMAFQRADDATGHVAAELNRTVLAFEMAEALEAGDGTVSVISGAAPYRFASSCVRTQLSVVGIDHQGAYSTDNEIVMDFIAYSICKIVKEAV